MSDRTGSRGGDFDPGLRSELRHGSTVAGDGDPLTFVHRFQALIQVVKPVSNVDCGIHVFSVPHRVEWEGQPRGGSGEALRSGAVRAVPCIPRSSFALWTVVESENSCPGVAILMMRLR